MTTEEKLAEEYQKAQKKLVQIIMKKQAHGSAAAYERSLLRQIQKELKKLKKTSKATVEQLVRENYKTGLQSLINDIIKDTSAPKMYNMMSGLNTSQIDIIVQNTNASLNNIINLVGRQIQDIIREAGAEATAEKLTTGQTVREMQKNLEQKLKEQDITSVKYRNGKRVSIQKYAAMVARSTTAETQNKAKAVQGEQWGYDLVRFTRHSPTCKVCSMYQGRVYALTKEAANGKYKGSKGQSLHFPYLYDTALPHGYSTIHPNCRHRLSVLPAGAYTTAEMEDFSQKSTQPFEDMRSDKERKEYAKEQEIKRKRNAARRQYEEIKATLPNEAPKTFAGFVKMKSAKSERYKELLQDYKAVIGIAKQQESGIIEAENKPLEINIQLFAKIPKEKFTKYALDPIKQPDKARAFRDALGYTMENYQELIENIQTHFDENSMVLKMEDKFGKRYELVMNLTGANGKNANVCTAWIKENEDAEPRLTSAYVTKKKVTDFEN